jgi:hypothetical protein
VRGVRSDAGVVGAARDDAIKADKRVKVFMLMIVELTAVRN